MPSPPRLLAAGKDFCAGGKLGPTKVASPASATLFSISYSRSEASKEIKTAYPLEMFEEAFYKATWHNKVIMIW